MNTEEKQLARLAFRYEVFRKHGFVFEMFFHDVMEALFPDQYQRVKLQGRMGDRSNDGFRKNQGIYYQVYAPKNPVVKDNEGAKKAADDFENLYNYWNEKFEVKEYYFVFNDKYDGAYPETNTVIAELRERYPSVKIDVLMMKELEGMLLQSADQDIIANVTGILPNPTHIGKLKFAPLDDVVKFLIDKKFTTSISQELFVPNFEQKIQFNSLSPQVSTLLTKASYHLNELEEYFQSYGNKNIRSELQRAFVNLYKESTKDHDDQNLQFFYILNNAMSESNNQVVGECVLVLMAYYFESCDIFEKPEV